MDGGVDLGPNAVLAFAREGYRYTDVNVRELAEALSYRYAAHTSTARRCPRPSAVTVCFLASLYRRPHRPHGRSGMQRLVSRHWRDGASELYRSLWPSAQVRQLQRYVPSLRYSHVVPGCVR